MATLHELAPELVVTRDGLALRIEIAKGRALAWNLHDFARLAARPPGFAIKPAMLAG